MKRFLAAVMMASMVFAFICAIGFAATAHAAQGYEFSDGSDDPLEGLPPEILSTENLPKENLAATSKEVLEYMRNRIYANRGFVFKSKKWREEFARFDWYEPNEKFSLESLNKFERNNLWNIVKEEKKHK